MLRAKEKLDSELHLKARNVEMLVGLTLLCKGLWLEVDSNYFFYPPNLAPIMNSRIIDCGMMLVGIILFICSFYRPKDCKWRMINRQICRVMLILGATIFLALALLQLTHGIFTPSYRMNHTAIGDLFIFVIIDLTACDA